MSNKKNAGGCQCGAVRFETSESPVRAMACHCTTCKQRTGAPYGIGVYFKEEDVRITTGEEAIDEYEFHSDTSGRWIRNMFCRNCGSAVAWKLEMRPGLMAIAGGSFDDPDWFPIQAHIWTRSARSDMAYPDNIPVYPEALPS